MGRVDSYTPHATSGSAITQHSVLGHRSRVVEVAASKQFDLTGSDAGNSEFIIHGTPNAGTIITFADGSSTTAAKLVANADVQSRFEYTISKIVTVVNTATILWK